MNSNIHTNNALDIIVVATFLSAFTSIMLFIATGSILLGSYGFTMLFGGIAFLVYGIVLNRGDRIHRY